MTRFAALLSETSDWCRQVWQGAADFLFPPVCSLCGATDDRVSRTGVCFCLDCIEQLAPAPRNRCRVCAAEIGPYADALHGCIHCRKRTFRFDTVVCLGMYDDPLRRVLLSAKWSFSAVRMKSLACLLATHRRQELQALKATRIVPIPQHWRQRCVRHFNPAWVIGSELARQLHVPCDVHLLARARRTKLQKRVPVTKRFENQQDAFRLKDPHLVRGERILLVDDVLTSGATCSEAARLLLDAGAESCSVAVIARVLDHSA